MIKSSAFLAASLLLVAAQTSASEAVSSAHPSTSQPLDFHFHLDPCPFADDYPFSVVITNLDDEFLALGEGAGVDGVADITPDLAEFEDGLPDGVYKAWIRDSEDPYGESFSFAFVVLKTALLDSISATGTAATFDARDFFEMDDEFIVDLLSGTSTTLSGSFLDLLQANGYDFPLSGVVSLEYSLDGEDYNDDNLEFDAGSFTLDVSGLDDGPHAVYLRWIDVSGEYGYDAYCFYVDNTPPTVTWFDENGNLLHDGDTITNQFICVTAGFWDEVAMPTFTAYSGTIFTLGYQTGMNSNEWLYIYTWNTPLGTYFIQSNNYDFNSWTLTATTTDLAGNTTTSSILIHYALAPTVTWVSPNDAAWVRTSTPEIYAEFSVPAGGTLANQIMTIDAQTVDSYIDGNRVYASAPSLSDGTHTVTVIAGNYVGSYLTAGYTWTYDTYMMPAAYSWTIGVDTVPPTLTSATITDGILTVSASDATSGVSFIDLRIDGCGGHFRPFALDGDPVEFDTSELVEGDYYINGTIIDLAGNAYRFTAMFTMPEEGDAEVADIADDQSFDIQIRRRVVPPGVWSLANVYVPPPDENVWIGECVESEIVFVDPDQLNELLDEPLFYWSIPSDSFAYYNLSMTAGTVQNIGDGENDERRDFDSLTWYWWKVPEYNPALVVCQIQYVTLDGIFYPEVSTTFNVHAPNCTLAATYGTSPNDATNTCRFPNPDPDNLAPTTVPLDPGGINVEYETNQAGLEVPTLIFGIDGGPLTPIPENTFNPLGEFVNDEGDRFDMPNQTGIRFDTTLSNFNSTADTYFFMQIMMQCHVSRTGFKTIANGQTPEEVTLISLSMEPEEHEAVYDLDFLFDETPTHDGSPFIDLVPAQHKTVAYWDVMQKTSTPTLSIVDRPSNFLNSSKYSEFLDGSGFSLYVMYKPAVSDKRSIPVPLKVCKWGCWREAYQGGCSENNSTGNGLWTKNSYSTPYKKEPFVPYALPQWNGNVTAVHWNGTLITNLLAYPNW